WRSQQSLARTAFEGAAGGCGRPLERHRAARGETPCALAQCGIFHRHAELLEQALPGSLARYGVARVAGMACFGSQLQGVMSLIRLQAALQAELRLAQTAGQRGL